MQLQVLVAKSADETVDGDKNELNASKWVWKNDEKNQIKWIGVVLIYIKHKIVLTGNL